MTFLRSWRTRMSFGVEPNIVAHGELYPIDQLPGYKAIASEQLIGFIHFEIKAEQCEILTPGQS